MTGIKARKPTGAVPYPLVLIEGAEKSGKSYACAQFTASNRIGQAYWLDIGEGAADEYAAIDGTNYLVIEHDGSWPDIIGQVQAVHDEATRALKAGEKPVVLIIDSMTAEWSMLKDWTTHRARESKYNKRVLASDPNAEIKVSPNYWNDANQRHQKLMHLLMTFPGIVLVTARGKEVAVMDDKGQPIPNTKEHKVDGHKDLAFDVTAWVTLSRDHAPLVQGVRSIHAGLRPGVDKPKPAPQFSVEWLIFDVMKCDPVAAHVRDHVASKMDDPVAAVEKPTSDVEGSRLAAPTPTPEPNWDAIEARIETETDISPAGFLAKSWKRLADFDTERANALRDKVVARFESLKEPSPDEAVETVQETLDAEIINGAA